MNAPWAGRAKQHSWRKTPSMGATGVEICQETLEHIAKRESHTPRSQASAQPSPPRPMAGVVQVPGAASQRLVIFMINSSFVQTQSCTLVFHARLSLYTPNEPAGSSMRPPASTAAGDIRHGSERVLTASAGPLSTSPPATI